MISILHKSDIRHGLNVTIVSTNFEASERASLLSSLPAWDKDSVLAVIKAARLLGDYGYLSKTDIKLLFGVSTPQIMIGDFQTPILLLSTLNDMLLCAD